MYKLLSRWNYFQNRPFHSQKQAAYYNQPTEEFHHHNARSRKALTFYLDQPRWEHTAVSLTLHGGQQLSGHVEWWDLASIGLRQENGRLLVIHCNRQNNRPVGSQRPVSLLRLLYS